MLLLFCCVIDIECCFCMGNANINAQNRAKSQLRLNTHSHRSYFMHKINPVAIAIHCLAGTRMLGKPPICNCNCLLENVLLFVLTQEGVECSEGGPSHEVWGVLDCVGEWHWFVN